MPLYKHIYELEIYSLSSASIEAQLADLLDMVVVGLEDEPGVFTAHFIVNDPVGATPEEISYLAYEEEE